MLTLNQISKTKVIHCKRNYNEKQKCINVHCKSNGCIQHVFAKYIIISITDATILV